MTKTMMKKYAKAIAEIGANVRKGQEVKITTSPAQEEFAAILTEACYKRGAKKVTVDFVSDLITKETYKYATEDTLAEVPNWRVEKLKHELEVLPVNIYIDDMDPDALAGVDMSKVMKARMRSYKIIKPLRDEMENKYQWVIAAMPNMVWAKKVFPDLPAKKAYKALEDAILFISRIPKNGNPVKAWDEHIEVLTSKAKILNDYHFDYLEYTSSNGTNLKIKLVKDHLWISAREETIVKKKVTFTPNMPTEEVFTMPDYNGVDGIVYSTKPLSYQGNLIVDFNVTFKDGRVTEVHAKQGEKVLKQMLEMDEGSKHLGEVALVPWDSPVNQTGILFYNTLFDENAACHLAFGMAFKDNIIDFTNRSEEYWNNLPYNDSMNHVDFMVGANDLSIVGTTSDGKKVQIFKNGTWSI